MEKEFKFEIVTPNRVFYSDDIEMVVFSTPEGEMGILKNHMPMVVAVDIGIIKIKKDNEIEEAVVSDGFLEITDEKVIMFVDSAEWPDEIDVERAKEALERAKKRLKDNVTANRHIEYRAKASLGRAVTRIKLAERHRKLR